MCFKAMQSDTWEALFEQTQETEGKWMIAYRDIKDIEVEKIPL